MEKNLTGVQVVTNVVHSRKLKSDNFSHTNSPGATYRESDNDNGKQCNYVCMTSN